MAHNAPNCALDMNIDGQMRDHTPYLQNNTCYDPASQWPQPLQIDYYGEATSPSNDLPGISGALTNATHFYGPIMIEDKTTDTFQNTPCILYFGDTPYAPQRGWDLSQLPTAAPRWGHLAPDNCQQLGYSNQFYIWTQNP